MPPAARGGHAGEQWTTPAASRSTPPAAAARLRRDLRITVYDVLDYPASGMTEAEILADFPELTADDLRACLAFAADCG